MLVDAELPLVVKRHVDLGVTFIKAGAFLGEVTVDRETDSTLGEIDAVAEDGAISLQRSALRAKALSAWIEITPNTEVEGEHTDGRTNTAVEPQILVEVVARFEIGRDRGLVIGLGDTAEDVIVHQRAAEGEIPRLERRWWRRPDSFDSHICRIGGTRSHRKHRRDQNHFL